MRRREFIKFLAGAASWTLTARAQDSGKLFRIGFLGSTSANGLRERTKAFRDGLRALDHEEGRDIVIESRWADGHYERDSNNAAQPSPPPTFDDAVRVAMRGLLLVTG